MPYRPSLVPPVCLTLCCVVTSAHSPVPLSSPRMYRTQAHTLGCTSSISGSSMCPCGPVPALSPLSPTSLPRPCATPSALSFSLLELKKGGCPGSELRQAGYSASAMLRPSVGFTESELHTFGYDAQSLLRAGCKLATLREAGYRAVELRAAGASVPELKACGFSAADLLEASLCTVKELMTAGYTAAELSRAGACARADWRGSGRHRSTATHTPSPPPLLPSPHQTATHSPTCSTSLKPLPPPTTL